MQIDPAAARSMQTAVRRSPWLLLLSTLLELAQGKAELVRHAERSWASATFSGTRHSVVLSFTGADAIAAGEALIETLPDHEFTIPGQLVADANVIAAEHTTLPQPQLQLEIELLLLEDC